MYNARLYLKKKRPFSFAASTAGHDAPSLSGLLVPLLLYADDLTIMSTTPAGLQRQINALQLFCEQRQLTVNLSKPR